MTLRVNPPWPRPFFVGPPVLSGGKKFFPMYFFGSIVDYIEDKAEAEALADKKNEPYVEATRKWFEENPDWDRQERVK